MTYRVRDWAELYETASTRKRRQLGWVLIPNRHDSLGYNQLISRPDGLEMFAAWVLILQCASRCPERGLLVSDTGKPYTAQDIAAKTRAPVDKIEVAFAALVEIGWLESANKVARRANKVADDANKVADDANKVADRANNVADDANKVARSATLSGSMLPLCQDEERKKEREKERKKAPLTPQGEFGEGDFDSSLFSDPEFVRMWAAWLDHNKDKGQPLTSARQIAHIEALENSTPTEAVARLQLSIARNWQAPAKAEEEPPSTRERPRDNTALIEELTKGLP